MSEPPDLENLARRYLDLWQDQMTAIAADPEMAEAFSRSLNLMSGWLGASGVTAFPWMGWAASVGAEGSQRPEHGKSPEPKRPGNDGTPAGAAAAAPASRDRAVDLAELARRVAELEKRLAALEGKPRKGGGRPRKGSRERRT